MQNVRVYGQTHVFVFPLCLNAVHATQNPHVDVCSQSTSISSLLSIPAISIHPPSNLDSLPKLHLDPYVDPYNYLNESLNIHKIVTAPRISYVAMGR